MKSILIIGLGDFGHYLCRELMQFKNEIMIIDQDETALEDLTGLVTSSLIGDCTRESVLRSIGVQNFDLCFVCISGNFQANLEITSLLKDLGAKYVVSQVRSEIHSKFLLRNGADEVIHPNKVSAKRAAVKYSSDRVFDYIDLGDGYSIYEITPLKEWVNKSILDSNIRARYDMYIIGIVSKDDVSNYMPTPQTVIEKDDHLMVLAHESTMARFMD
ncbi:MAG: TrkA family potassium uptake protein [Oscillospiraceae bacterium]|nr:TrkA family potassium uptake protein [Ruminococcus sp.]MCD8345160.1 TrkA family potassium uptake protein [Oscillospiraceae bacterium]